MDAGRTFDGKVAVVTGAGQGIGEAYAKGGVIAASAEQAASPAIVAASTTS